MVSRQRPAVGRRATGRVVVIGNWLHTDGLMARLKNTGIFKVLEFPLLREGDGTEGERCTWKAKYPTQAAIDRKRDELGDIGFRREMLLQVVPEEGQDVLPEDIHYYDDPPFDDGNYLAHGVDLAISTKESADYTAIVIGEVTWNGEQIEIYIQPNPIIRRMTFHDTMDALDNVRTIQPDEQRILRRKRRISAGRHRGNGAAGVRCDSHASDQGQARAFARGRALHQERHREVSSPRMRAVD